MQPYIYRSNEKIQNIECKSVSPRRSQIFDQSKNRIKVKDNRITNTNQFGSNYFI
jgi:hypothetical protein